MPIALNLRQSSMQDRQMILNEWLSGVQAVCRRRIQCYRLGRRRLICRNSSARPLMMQDISLHYKFVFDVGRAIDLTEGATRLLATDMGVTAVSQFETWDAARLVELKRLRKQHDELEKLQHRSDRGISSFLWFVLTHPRTIPLFLRAILRGDESDQSTDSNDEDMSFDDIEERVARQSVLQSLFRYVDRTVFNPDFMDKEPWLRVELQPVIAERFGKEYAIDVGLVLHRSGTAILTFYVFHEPAITATQLGKLSISGNLLFDKTEMVSWIAEAAAATQHGWEVVPAEASRTSGGVEWGTWQHPEPASLTNIFETYQTATLACLNARKPTRPKSGDARAYSSQWFCYPVVCVRRPDPRSFDKSDDDAQAQIGALITRVGDGLAFRTDYLRAVAETEVSIVETRRYWVGGPLAVLLIAEEECREMATRAGGYDNIPGQDWIHIEQALAAPLDFLLLQDHTAHALIEQVNTSALTPVALHELKARVLVAWSDFCSPSRFSFGSLTEMARTFQADRQTPQAWSLLRDNLELVQSVVDAESNAASARRSLALELMVGIVAVVLGIPALHQIISLLGKVDPPPAQSLGGLEVVINSVLAFVGSYSGPLIVALAAILIVLVLSVLRVGRQSRGQRAPLVSRAQGAATHQRPYQYFPGQNVSVTGADDR